MITLLKGILLIYLALVLWLIIDTGPNVWNVSILVCVLVPALLLK